MLDVCRTENLDYRHRMDQYRGLEVCRPDMLVIQSDPPSQASSPYDELMRSRTRLLHINYIQGSIDR
jgi:hypothetical protein